MTTTTTSIDKNASVTINASYWREPLTRGLSLAARGLYVDMLILSVSDLLPWPGYASAAGITPAEVAAAVGCDAALVGALLDELMAAGVLKSSGQLSWDGSYYNPSRTRRG